MAKNMKKKAIGVLVNDIHLNKDNGELVKDIMNQVISLCLERKIKNIFCGGDVFTNRSGQPLSCLTTWSEILREIEKAGLNFEAIPGNHDKTDDDDERSYLDVYQKSMNVHRSGEYKVFSGVVVAFIPYFRDEKWLEEYNRICQEILESEDMDEDCVKILITHSGFDGVMNNDGSKVESLIKPSMFKEWDKILIGHYHNASKLAENVIYTGSAYQNNYGETLTDKGCTIIYDDGSIEFVPLKFPKYIKEIVDVNDNETLRNLIDKYDGEDYDHIRFVFRGSKADASKVDKETLSRLGIDAKFEAEETGAAIMAAEETGTISFDRKSIVKDFVKFCSENGIREKRLQYGLKLIKSI